MVRLENMRPQHRTRVVYQGCGQVMTDDVDWSSGGGTTELRRRVTRRRRRRNERTTLELSWAMTKQRPETQTLLCVWWLVVEWIERDVGYGNPTKITEINAFTQIEIQRLIRIVETRWKMFCVQKRMLNKINWTDFWFQVFNNFKKNNSFWPELRPTFS